MRNLGLILALVGLLGLSACTGTTRSVGYHVESYIVDLRVEPNGDVRVTETLKYVYQQGVYRFGYAFIPRGRTDGIADVEVWEGNQRYRPTTAADAEEQPFTYRVQENALNDRLEIRWFYPSTYRNARTFTLKYTLRHAVRIYPAGDQLWAVAIGGEHASTIYIARAIIHLPVDVTPSDLLLAAHGVAAETEVLDSRTVQFFAYELAPGEWLEVRIQWPHGHVTETKPAWQVREEHIQTAVAWGTVLALVFLVVGFGGLFLLWYVKGRDPRVGEVATYLPYPPGDPAGGESTDSPEQAGPGLPPALAGLLLDGKTSLRHIVATIVDLARRGAISITEWGAGDYEFKLLWDDARTATLRPYERDVLEALFSPLQAMEIGAALVRTDLQTRVSLRDVRKTFESYVRPIFGALAREGVQAGLFEEHPEATAGRYFGVGMGLLLGTAVALSLLFVLSPNVLNTLWGGLTVMLNALSMFGEWGFMVFVSVAFGAVMTVLAVLGQVVGRYTWYAALSPWTYMAFLIAVIGFGGGGGLFGSLLVVLPPALAVALWSLGLILFSLYMARTTPQGALERARWQAFKRYLSQIELFGDLAAAREIFDRYLPYAIAFGVEKTWVRKFIVADTPAPAWFLVPTLAARPAGHYLRSGLGPASPDVVMATASLSEVGGGLTHSLQDVSDGLFTMLGSVSTSLRVGPLQPSGMGGPGRGSGGWSGGGWGSGGVGGGARGVG